MEGMMGEWHEWHMGRYCIWHVYGTLTFLHRKNPHKHWLFVAEACGSRTHHPNRNSFHEKADPCQEFFALSLLLETGLLIPSDDSIGSSPDRKKRPMKTAMNSRWPIFGQLFLGLVIVGCGEQTISQKPPPPPPSIPAITSQPASRLVRVGEMAAFNVVASGTSPLTYQWLRNGQVIAGATSASYTTPATTMADDQTNLQVIVTNAAGSVGSDVVSLGVMWIISDGFSGLSTDVALSSTGRSVTFDSSATVADLPQSYIFDTCIGANNCSPIRHLVSAVTGTETVGNGQSEGPSVSADGRFVAFISGSTNLVTLNTKFFEAYVRDTCAGVASGCQFSTSLVSLTQNNSEPNADAYGAVLSANGCTTVFVSNATNVAPGVSVPSQAYLNDTCSPSAPVSGLLVSADNFGNPANDFVQDLAISADGRFVAFSSGATNLPNASSHLQEIYVRDTCNRGPPSCTPTTTLVSANDFGVPFQGTSLNVAISADGRFALFDSFVQIQSNRNATLIVFLRDTCNSSTGAVANCSPSTKTISLAGDGGIPNNDSASGPFAISGDGRFVAFTSNATNLIVGGNPANQVFIRDTCANAGAGCQPKTVRVAEEGLGFAAISGDGHYVAFMLNIRTGDIVPTTVQHVILRRTGF
jgi:hypothetical protein